MKNFGQCAVKSCWLLVITAVLAVIVSNTMVRGNEMISLVIDEMLGGKEIQFGTFAVRFLLFTVIGAGAAFAQRIVSSKYALKVCTEYKDLLAEKLYRIEYKYFDSNYSATLLNKVIGDLGEIANFLESVLPEILSGLIALITYSIYIGQLNPGLLALILVSYPLIFGIASMLVKRISSLQVTYRQKTDAMTEITQDAVSGILVLRSFGIEDVFRKKMHSAAQDLVENEEKRTQISNTAIIIRKLVQWLPNIISAVYAIYLVRRGEISLGGLVAFILILNKFVEAFIGLPFCMVDASAGVVSVKRVEEIMNAEIEPSGTETIALDTKVAICFDEVDFGYEENKIVSAGENSYEDMIECLSKEQQKPVLALSAPIYLAHYFEEPNSKTFANVVKFIERLKASSNGMLCAFQSIVPNYGIDNDLNREKIKLFNTYIRNNTTLYEVGGSFDGVMLN